MYTCTKCKLQKPLEMMRTDCIRQCRACKNEYQKKRYATNAEHREATKARTRQRHEDIKAELEELYDITPEELEWVRLLRAEQ